MRGFFSSFLILLILLNTGGYYGLFWGIEYEASKKIIMKLDGEKFNPAETMLIKIPISVPYAPDSKDFERVDGTIEHEGQIFRLVKQKLSRDTLHVVIYKDRLGTNIHKAKTDLAKSLTDQPVDQNNSKGSKIIKNLIKDYLTLGFQYEAGMRGLTFFISSTKHYNFYSSLSSRLLAVPPEI